ncbi:MULTISPECIES: hypothetical protein [Helicobacter]|uniref:hypothetical protein n=1 Tax=Helicobacter TaxID=209 RepID=UPI001EF1277C|nr:MULTISPECIES: hypothetical protein [Helicobacter]BDB64130.1 hypothetical protein T36_0577 [Helicobacter cinaedi]
MKSFLSIFCIGKICLCRAGLFLNSMKNKSNNVNFKNKYCYEIKENIPINWIHTDSSGNYSEKISREKALEMKNAYRMRDKASLTSNHILGKAIDMTITWTKNIKIKDKTGKKYTLTPNMVLNVKNSIILEQLMESISW